MGPPSAAPASAIVTVALPPVPPSSSSVIVPVAGVPVVTPSGASEMLRPTVNVSSCSITSSWVVATVKVCVSPAVPAKVRAVVSGV